MKKESIAKIIIFLLTSVAGALGTQYLDPEIAASIDVLIGAVAGLGGALIANWLHQQPSPKGPFA